MGEGQKLHFLLGKCSFTTGCDWITQLLYEENKELDYRWSLPRVAVWYFETNICHIQNGTGRIANNMLKCKSCECQFESEAAPLGARRGTASPNRPASRSSERSSKACCSACCRPEETLRFEEPGLSSLLFRISWDSDRFYNELSYVYDLNRLPHPGFIWWKRGRRNPKEQACMKVSEEYEFFERRDVQKAIVQKGIPLPSTSLYSEPRNKIKLSQVGSWMNLIESTVQYILPSAMIG